jgi:hypothetical protein
MKDGGPAFPAYTKDDYLTMDGNGHAVRRDIRSPGMTLRAYLAGRAMQGFIEQGATDEVTTAQASVRYADALIAELRREVAG